MLYLYIQIIASETIHHYKIYQLVGKPLIQFQKLLIPWRIHYLMGDIFPLHKKIHFSLLPKFSPT